MIKRSALSERLYFIAGLIMVLIYAGAGIAILFWNTTSFSDSTKKVFGATLLIYSLYRAYMLFRNYNSSEDENPA